MSNERQPIEYPEQEATTRPSYERIAAGLTRVLAESGVAVRDGFLPNKLLSSYDRASRSLVVHPWISPKARAEILLGESVRHLAVRKKRAQDESRPWFIEATLDRRYGLPVDPAAAHGHGELTKKEQALVARIVAAIETEADDPL